MNWSLLIAFFVVAAALGGIAWLRFRGLRPVPPQLRPGSPLPAIAAHDEQGASVSSADLNGRPAVILFVRGNWCPFCNAQVKNLAAAYREISELGAQLILLTPKPLSTTRRVAKFFEVDFRFWLDDSLAVAREFGLLLPNGVPRGHREEYGADTVWPAALVVDARGIIRFTELSKHISDRPDPGTLLKEVRKTLDH